MNARRVLVSVLFNYLGAITGSLAGFIATPIVLGHLGKAAYGAWALIAAIIGYSSLLDLGVGLTVMRQVAQRAHLEERKDLNRIVSTGLTIYGCVGLVIIVAGVIAAPRFASSFGFHGGLKEQFTLALILMVTTLGLTFPGGLYTGINQGFGRFRDQNLIVMGQDLLGTVTMVVIVLLGGGLVALAIGWMVCVALGFVAKAIYAARVLGLVPHPRRFEPGLARSLMSISFWMFIINIANKVIWNTDTVVVGSVIGAVAVAHYAVALGPATGVRTLTDQFNSVTYTAAASLRAQSQHETLRRLLLEATRVTASCICPFVVLFLLWGSQFLRLWVGASLASSAPTLVVLVIGMLATSVQATATQILLASELQSRIAAVAVLEAIANLTCSILLAHRIGIEGVALGTTIPTTLTAFGFYVPKAARLVSVPVRTVLLRIFVPVALSATVYLVMRFAVPTLHFSSLPVFCAFAAVFVGVVVIIGVLSDPAERGTYLGIVLRSRARRLHQSEASSRMLFNVEERHLNIPLDAYCRLHGHSGAPVSVSIFRRVGRRWRGPRRGDSPNVHG
jgi:O-antigen/teichoic acid export membrane protein